MAGGTGVDPLAGPVCHALCVPALAPADLTGERVLPVLERALGAASIASRQVRPELTERASVNPRAAQDPLARLRMLGHVVAIDAFGIGYSSRAYLRTRRSTSPRSIRPPCGPSRATRRRAG